MQCLQNWRFHPLKKENDQEIINCAVHQYINDKDRLKMLFEILLKQFGVEEFKMRFIETIKSSAAEAMKSNEFSFPILTEPAETELPVSFAKRSLIKASVHESQMRKRNLTEITPKEPRCLSEGCCTHPLATDVLRSSLAIDENQNWQQHLSRVKAIFETSPKALHEHLDQPSILQHACCYFQQASKPLRKYQIDFIRLCENGGNFVFCALDPLSKVNTLVGCSRYFLDQDRAKRIVVLEPTGTHVLKQVAAYLLEALPSAGCNLQALFDSSKDMLASQSDEVEIIILTPERLLNSLSDPNFQFHSTDLLILDDFEYYKGDSYHVLIMDLYNKMQESGQHCQVLGFTDVCSMGRSKNPHVMGLELPLLKIDAQLVIISETKTDIEILECRSSDGKQFDALCENNVDKYDLRSTS